jgi:riboflavin synthase
MDAYNTQAKKTAQNLIARLNQGEDFATLASSIQRFGYQQPGRRFGLQ